MRFRLTACFVLALSLPAWSAEKPKLLKVLRQTTEPEGKCETGWKRAWGSGLFWIDEEHIAASQTYSCTTPHSTRSEYSTELTILDTNASGPARSRRVGSVSGIQPGPSGSLLVAEGDVVSVLDNDLQVEQTLPCPVQNARCTIYRSNSATSDSDFAICSNAKTKTDCVFYRGLPCQEVSESKIEKPPSRKFVSPDPYQEMAISGMSVPPHQGGVWKVTPSELWYFDAVGTPFAIDSNSVTTRISRENLLRDGGGCRGELSGSEPRRFLAICGGVSFYTDGALDSLFAYTRVALFDVATRKLLARFSGGAKTAAALSRSGKLVAIAHKKEVRLYEVN